MWDTHSHFPVGSDPWSHFLGGTYDKNITAEVQDHNNH